jgi:hypothetical protein
VKWLKHEAGHSSSCGARVKNSGIINTTTSQSLCHGACLIGYGALPPPHNSNVT